MRIKSIMIIFLFCINKIININCLYKINKNDQLLIFNKINKRVRIVKDEDINDDNINKILDKKIIKIAPEGIYGFYDFGISLFIKLNYNLTNYIFSGVSSGSWNSLFLTFNKDIKKFVDIIFDSEIREIKSLFTIQQYLKKKILLNYNNDDFDLEKLYICVLQIDNFRFKNIIYTNFLNLEDAINCCIASSNIPFVTGKLYYKYQNKLSFDGLFLKYPYLYLNNTSVNINNNMFLVNKSKDINILFKEGFTDSLLHKEELDGYFYN